MIPPRVRAESAVSADSDMATRFSARRLVGLAAVCTAIWVASVLISAYFGASTINFARALDAGLTPNPDRTILFADRLPRAALASVVGAALALVGCAFQSLMRNPLADPFILGTSGGAALGATAGLLTGATAITVAGVTISLVSIYSFVGALGALGLVHAAAVGSSRFDSARILLLGIVFNFFASAVITFLKAVVGASRAQEILLWLMGSLSVGGLDPWSLLAPALFTVVGAVWLIRRSVALNAMSLGSDAAQALGVDVARVRRQLFVACSLMVGAAVSVAGLIGFVGLVVPHAARLAIGPDHRLLVPASGLLGASFLVLCDVAARLAFPLLQTEAPVGVVTAFVGGPVFAWLLLRQRSVGSGWSE